MVSNNSDGQDSRHTYKHISHFPFLCPSIDSGLFRSGPMRPWTNHSHGALIRFSLGSCEGTTKKKATLERSSPPLKL